MSVSISEVDTWINPHHVRDVYHVTKTGSFRDELDVRDFPLPALVGVINIWGPVSLNHKVMEHNSILVLHQGLEFPSLLVSFHLLLQISFLFCPLYRKSDLDGKGCHMAWFAWDNPSFYKGLLVSLVFCFFFPECSSCFFFNFFYWLYFFILGSQQNWAEGIEISTPCIPPPMYSLSHYRQPHQSGTFCYNW